MKYKNQSGIDVHNHWVPEKYIDDIKKGRLKDLAFFVKTEKGDTLQFPVPGNDTKAWIPVKQEMIDFEKRYQDMADTSVEKTVICPVPFAFHYHGEPEHVLEVCQLLNDSTAEAVSRDTARLRGLAHVPLQSPHLAVK
ncbi:MAG: amidohydrolase family protein, partial [Spirochaetota bacterium]|nr:amidohydrolase family protein [Spirochaetota bacterium]